MTKDKTIKIRLDSNELKMLKHFAKANGLTVSDYIRKQTIGFTKSYQPLIKGEK